MSHRNPYRDPEGDPAPLDFDPDNALRAHDVLRQLSNARRRGTTQPTTHEALCPRCGVSMSYHGRLDHDGHASSLCPDLPARVL